jgi:hypothetical protein
MSILDIVGLVLVGNGALGVLVSAIVGVLKSFGVVKDGQSGKWVQGLNLLTVVVLSLLIIFGIQPDIATIELVAGAITALLGVFTLQPSMSKVAYMHNRDTVKVLGYSYSKPKKK